MKEQRREVILNKATDLFARKDYYEVMMDDVAHLSKVAKGTLYNYFNSKEQIYNQIILNNLESLLDSLKSSLSNELPIIELLYTYVSGVYQFLVSHKNFFRIYQKFIWKEDEEINSAIKLKSEELGSLLSDIIYKGKRENLLREVDEDFAVRLILGNIFSCVKRSIDNNFSEEQLNIEKENL
ncbi:MAG: TetR/AcrR family transcriptional regulator, partial [Ignavibacterium sp.]|uniref:TetR/AcrR family transcriptional regulator n=1 Tax=Ignavibacterium sp. TaxID=2651167 RepID=UPI00404B0D01